MEFDKEDVFPEDFEKRPDKMNRESGIPVDDLQEGMIVTILKNVFPSGPKVMMGPGMDSGEMPPELAHMMNMMNSKREDYRGGGTVLKIIALNLPYIAIKVWDPEALNWMNGPIVRDIRTTRFIKISDKFAKAMGIGILPGSNSIDP